VFQLFKFILFFFQNFVENHVAICPKLITFLKRNGER
jgi:hypothetical protein